MPSKTENPIAVHIRQDVIEQVSLFDSLWPRWETDGDVLPPHRQRTSVNKLRGYALFLGMPTRKGSNFGGAIRVLRNWQGRLGPIRDIDVSRQWIQRCAESGGEPAAQAAAALDDKLSLRRATLVEQVRVDARGLPGAQTRIALATARHHFETSLQQIGRRRRFDYRPPLRTVAEPWLAERQIIRGTQNDEEIHSFRVKNKKLRFVLEILAKALEGDARQEVISQRAVISAEVHNALGNLSDLLVLRNEVRMARANWAELGANLDESAAVLETARTTLEAENFKDWFARWPLINSENFLGDLLKR